MGWDACDEDTRIASSGLSTHVGKMSRIMKRGVPTAQVVREPGMDCPRLSQSALDLCM